MKVLGIDPGTHVGWCIVDVRADTARWCEAGTIELAPGGEIQVAGKLSMMRQGVELIAIEDFAKKWCSPAQAQQMVQSAQSAGIIRGWLASQCSVPLVAFSSYDWRKVITGTSTAKDKQIEHALVEIQHVADLPKRSNPHVRDACGLAIYAGRVALADTRAA